MKLFKNALGDEIGNNPIAFFKGATNINIHDTDLMYP